MVHNSILRQHPFLNRTCYDAIIIISSRMFDLLAVGVDPKVVLSPPLSFASPGVPVTWALPFWQKSWAKNSENKTNDGQSTPSRPPPRRPFLRVLISSVRLRLAASFCEKKEVTKFNGSFILDHVLLRWSWLGISEKSNFFCIRQEACSVSWRWYTYFFIIRKYIPCHILFTYESRGSRKIKISKIIIMNQGL